MGSNHEKNGGRKSRDTLPLKIRTVKQIFSKCTTVDKLVLSQQRERDITVQQGLFPPGSELLV